MKVYEGKVSSTDALDYVVTCDDVTLDSSFSLALRNHSPDGFAWGYAGSGPSQLALALLLDVIGDGDIALAFYQDFKRDFVSQWGKRWRVTSDDIERWVSQQQPVVVLRLYGPKPIEKSSCCGAPAVRTTTSNSDEKMECSQCGCAIVGTVMV